MPILLDTNQLLRLSQPSAPEYPVVRDAIKKFLRENDRPRLCPQNLYEYWAVATRPAGTAANGLGMTAADAMTEMEEFEKFFPILPDNAEVYKEWHALIKQWSVTGRQSFDARLVAVMIVHRIPNLLTLDVKHFEKYEERGIVIAGQPLRVIHPGNA